jgi:hypothetical protein
MEHFNMDRSFHEDFGMMAPSALPFNLQVSSSLPAQFPEPEPLRKEPNLVTASSKSGKRHQYSKDQWEELKPLIRRLYNEENKTFSKVASILRDSHDFFPT